MMMKRKKILVSVTAMNDWPSKIKEIDELSIKEIALFPTPLKLPERKKLYNLLEKTGLKQIPHVHLRDDCQTWELDYFTKKYKTKVFNLHPTPAAIKFLKRNRKYKDQIFLENLESMPTNFLKFLNLGGGVCLDFAHWEDFGVLQKQTNYKNFKEILKRFKIGCNHISAIRKRKHRFYDPITKITTFCFNDHFLRDLAELNYVKKYKNYLSDIISIELENPLKRQLEIKKYLEKMLDL
jgi:hypothetical protein